MTRPWLALLPAAILVCLLSACAGVQPRGNLFNKKNAWTTPIPADATKISPDQFRRMVSSGELILQSTADIKAQAAARDKQFRDDKAFLASIPNPSPAIKALLEEARNYNTYQGDVPFKTSFGTTVVLNGLGTRLRNAVESYKLSQRPDNALTAYTQLYELLPVDLKAKAPVPDTLKGKSLTDIQAALQQLNELLAGVNNLDRTRLERSPIPPASPLPASKPPPPDPPRPGHGSDNNGPCRAPTGLVARYWFPLKNFVSPIKNQAWRGTCWDFAAIGAIESRELVQAGHAVNLSEQFLNNKVKLEWDPSTYTEGSWSDKVLNEAVDHDQALPSEAYWTYNRADGRGTFRSHYPPDTEFKDGNPLYYGGTCDAYDGTCSETAHEGRLYCMKFSSWYCGYAKVVYSGPGIEASRAFQVWASGQPFNLALYQLYLALGHVLIANFPVYRGFMNDTAGVVSDYSKTHDEPLFFDKDGKVIGIMEVPGPDGGHAVQIVGFITNEELAAGGDPSNIGGGGYFIIKNSWGCGAGDGGYYYVPADYVSGLFGSLYALASGGKLSEAWKHEQQYPDSSDAPKIAITPKPATVDLRVQSDLARFFQVSHPLAKSVILTVTSNRDGALYNGGWNTDPGTFGGHTLPYTFTTQGVRTLFLTASYGGNESHASFNVNVVNSPPTLTLVASGGAAHQGVPYQITAQEYDKNEAKSDTLCANTSWSMDVPDTLSSTSGCQVEVTFGETGTRTVRATTHDTEGLTGADTLTLDVQPPLANPYPRISSAGVYSREGVGSPMGFHCGSVRVPSGNTIDFGAQGCSFTSAPAPKRYSAQVKVEDPSGETLTYDWKVYVTINGSESLLEQSLGSSSSTFVLHNVHTTVSPVTNACRVTVKVNAPDPSRSKSRTVWTGKCTYFSVTVH